MFRLFRKSRGRREMMLAMVGVQMGERLVYFGGADPAGFAVLSTKVGLTGRACAVVRDASAAAGIEAAAAEEGVLVEVEAGIWNSSHAAGSFDVGVVDGALIAGDHADGPACLREIHRVLRAGARLVAVFQSGRGAGALIGLDHTSARASVTAMTQSLGAAGFRPVRLLGEREGLSFVEAFRPA